jgi:nucleotide-binding universal stress UspA family protein
MDTIVVGTDGSPDAEAAVRKVIELAGGSDAAVHLVAAYPGRSTLERLGMTAKQDTVDMRGVAMDVLARDERRFAEAGFAVEKHAREGDPAHVIMDVADEQDAGMIVVGARGTAGGGSRFTLGNVASKLAHHVSRSLLIVREN